MIQMNLQNRKRLTDLENKLMVAWVKGQLGTLGTSCTYCYILRWITNKDLYICTAHTELCSMLCASLHGRGIWERMNTRIFMAEFLCCSPEATTTLLIGYILQYQIRSFQFRVSAGVIQQMMQEERGRKCPRKVHWLSGKESACQCRRHGFDPWSGKIPHAPEQLSSCPTTAGGHNCWRLRALEPVLSSKKSLWWDACSLQLESSPCSLQWERSPGSSEDPAQPKINE